MDWLSDDILLFKVKKMCITIYQPKSNGILERCDRTLLDMLQTIEQEQKALGAKPQSPSTLLNLEYHS